MPFTCSSARRASSQASGRRLSRCSLARLRRVVDAPGQQAREVVGQRADRRRDRHLVVVQDHQQVGVHRAGVVHRLERHAGRHGAVADHRDRTCGFSPLRLAATAMPSAAEIEVRRVRGAESVVLRLAAPREAGDAVQHAQPRHLLAPAGEDLVRRRSGGRRPRRCGPRACRTRSAARWSARPCRGSTTGGRRSSTPSRARRRAARRRAAAAACDPARAAATGSSIVFSSSYIDGL